MTALIVGSTGRSHAIRAARTAQNKAIAAGDLDRVASFWTEDVTVRRALGQPLSGREAARKALEPPPAPATRLIYQRLTKDVEVSATWPLAFETGTWEGHQGTPAGPVVIGGRYSAQWVKRAEAVADPIGSLRRAHVPWRRLRGRRSTIRMMSAQIGGGASVVRRMP